VIISLLLTGFANKELIASDIEVREDETLWIFITGDIEVRKDDTYLDFMMVDIKVREDETFWIS
jgi:hypothetical protein